MWIRLLFALMQLDQIKIEDQKPVLVCVMDEKYLKNYYELVDQLRDNNINAEIFLDSKKNLGKQLTLQINVNYQLRSFVEKMSLKTTQLLLKTLKVLKVKIIKQFQKLI